MRPAHDSLAVLLACALSACDGDRQNGAGETASLGGAIAARTGSEAIPLRLVQSVATQQGLEPRQALRGLVDDAVAADNARQRGLDRVPPARWQLTAARARFTADRVLVDAKAGGAPTDDEIRILSQLHWRSVDRPVSVRVVHAIVLRPKEPASFAKARALAERLHDELGPARDAADFEARAKAVPAPTGLSIKVEELPPFAEDGAVTVSAGQMDATFAAAAHALGAPSATSNVVETPFGWHVIRLLERIPEQRMPMEERRAAFVDEACRLRASNVVEERLKVLRNAIDITVSPAAEDLMRSFHEAVSGEPAP